MAKLERTDKPISVLVDEIRRGVLGLPEIQRGYVWNRVQVRELLDSLYREYPSGLILLWKPSYELPQLRQFDTKAGSDSKPPELLILDGQQRLTSLKKVFDGDIDIWFNVDDESFQIFNKKLTSNPLWLSVTRILNEGPIKVWRDLKKALDQTDIKINDEIMDEFLTRLSKIGKIKDYSLPVMVIHTDDYNEVTESFIRVNSKGTRLKEAELAMARFAFNWSGVLVNEFQTALDEYESAHYYFEATFLMRCFVAIATGQSRFKYISGLWEKKQEELEQIWKKTKSAMDHAINFLRNNAGIESTEWIPSHNALIPLIAFLSEKNGQLSDSETKGLLYWFYEATIHSRFATSPETNLDQDLKAITSATPIVSLVNNLRHDRSNLEISEDMIKGKYQRHSLLPILFVLARRVNAMDWFTGTILSSTNVGSQHQLELHHIFPKAVLLKTEKYDNEEINDLANIAFLSEKANRTILMSDPQNYLPKIETNRLVSQYIPLDQKLWNIDAFKEFLVTRRKSLATAINEYMNDLVKA